MALMNPRLLKYKKPQPGSNNVNLRALLFSAVFHAMLLSVFALVSFSRNETVNAQDRVAAITISQVKEATQEPVLIRKPKIKPRTDIRPTMMQSKNSLVIPERKKSTVTSSGLSLKGKNTSDVSLPNAEISLPSTEFFGSQTDQRLICYVVDCSGSMQGLFSMVKKQLRQSIESLEPDQYFYIIFFHGNELIESGSGYLHRATDSAKKTAIDFINSIVPSGPTNAFNALKKAMAIRTASGSRPGQIYFLTDGFDLDQSSDQTSEDFALDIQKLRKAFAPDVKINTIGFWIEDTDGQILKKIAAQSNGNFVNIN